MSLRDTLSEADAVGLTWMFGDDYSMDAGDLPIFIGVHSHSACPLAEFDETAAHSMAQMLKMNALFNACERQIIGWRLVEEAEHAKLEALAIKTASEMAEAV